MESVCGSLVCLRGVRNYNLLTTKHEILWKWLKWQNTKLTKPNWTRSQSNTTSQLFFILIILKCTTGGITRLGHVVFSCKTIQTTTRKQEHEVWWVTPPVPRVLWRRLGTSQIPGSNYRLSGNEGGLLLYRFAAEFCLKRFEIEKTEPADLNSLVWAACEVGVSLEVVKTTGRTWARCVAFFVWWLLFTWLLFVVCFTGWAFWKKK